MREDVHSCSVHVTEPGNIFFGLSIHKVECRCEKLFVHRLHSFLWKRAGIFNRLFAYFSKLRIYSCVILVGGLALQYAAWTKLLTEVRILRIVRVVRLLLGIQVIEIAEELIEAVNRR